MKPWHIIGGFSLLILLIAAWRIVSYERERNAPVAITKNAPPPLTEDQTVVPKKMFIDSVKSARVLDGKPVWMKTGYTLPYYAYRTGRIDFAHEAGRLPPADELDAKDFVEVTAPADWVTSIARGPKNVFMVFTFPAKDGVDKKNGEAKGGEFATPVATLDGANSNWACDDIFFYQDPKTLYKWPADVWQAIAQHTAKQGMSELQTAMSLGNLQQSQSSDIGNRTVSYTTMDEGKTHHFTVAFAGDKATSVSSQ